MEARTSWLRDHQLWVEAFALANVLSLVFDIYLAHSSNAFRNPAEYIPLGYAIATVPLLTTALFARQRTHLATWSVLGHVAGWAGLAVGLAGVIFHLESRFFYERTLKSLTYSAPFAAPLAFTGIGLLLIMNRMVDPQSRAWAQWVVFLALGGCVGNFVFSLVDHAANGFFRPIEWLPVASSAMTVGFLVTPFLMPPRRRFLDLCIGVLALQGGVGVLGFVLHAEANLRGPAPSLWQNLLSGAPPLAPLLLPNLALLGVIGLWVLRGPATLEGSPAQEDRRRPGSGRAP